MHILEKISEFVGKWMALFILAVAALSLFLPKSTLWIELSWVNYLLMIVMFGMGLTLKLSDFALVFARPKEISIGCAAQFIVMPALAFVLSVIFDLDPALMAGVVLVGACPGGTASNVITYLSKGDIRLIGSTTYSEYSNTSRAVKVLPLVSVIAIAMIVGAVVSHNAAKILSTGAIVFAVVILHNLLGYGCGFGLGKLLKFSTPKTKALSIEIGMQNSGLATSLANTAFSSLAMATVPGAIFSVWHNISGAILANVYRRWEK